MNDINNEPRRYQVCNYILRIEIEDFDPMMYYNWLHQKLEITTLYIYRGIKKIQEYILVFSCKRRRDVTVDFENKILTPKFFHLTDTNYPFFETTSPAFVNAKVYEDSSKYHMVYQLLNPPLETLTLNDHVTSFTSLNNYTSKLDYVELHNLQGQLDILLKNSYIYSLLQINSLKESCSSTLEQENNLNSLKFLLEGLTNFSVKQEKVFSTQNLQEQKQEEESELGEFLDKNIPNKEILSYIFDSNNLNKVLEVLKNKKLQYDLGSKPYPNILKICLIHFKIISNPLKTKSRNKYLLDIYDYLPNDIKSIYSKYLGQ